MKNFWVNLAANNKAKKQSNQIHHDKKLPDVGCDNKPIIDKLMPTRAQAAIISHVSTAYVVRNEKLSDSDRSPALISNESESNSSRLLSKIDRYEPGISKESQD